MLFTIKKYLPNLKVEVNFGCLFFTISQTDFLQINTKKMKNPRIMFTPPIVRNMTWYKLWKNGQSSKKNVASFVFIPLCRSYNAHCLSGFHEAQNECIHSTMINPWWQKASDREWSVIISIINKWKSDLQLVVGFLVVKYIDRWKYPDWKNEHVFRKFLSQ